jgi:hypothetical protein
MMTEVSISRDSLYMMRAAVIVLAIAFLYLYLKPGGDAIVPSEPEVDPNDVVDVIIDDKRLVIPPDFQKALEDMGIASIALVNKQGQIRAVSVMGIPINLCSRPQKAGYNPSTCRLELPMNTFAKRLQGGLPRANLRCYECRLNDGTTVLCHTTARNRRKHPCGPGGHKYCSCPVP